jgi:hypothetical protein
MPTSKRTIATRKASGMCVQCGQRAARPGAFACAACAQWHRTYYAAHTERLRAVSQGRRDGPRTETEPHLIACCGRVWLVRRVVERPAVPRPWWQVPAGEGADTRG